MTRRGHAPRPPWALGVPAAVAVLVLVIPLLGLIWRAPWRRMPELLAQPDVLDALRLSLVCATAATAISLVLGVPLAWLLARGHIPGRPLLRALVTLPMVMPPVVGGIALLLAFGREGLVGHWLDEWFGLTLPFTTPAVILAETFVAMPFLVVSVEGALRSAGQELEEAAATLGATRVRAFRLVTLPTVLPALVAGSVLTWARALGEFGATITFAGSLPGTTETLSLAAYFALQDDPDAAVALSLVLLAVCLLVLVGLRERWWPHTDERAAPVTGVAT